MCRHLEYLNRFSCLYLKKVIYCGLSCFRILDFLRGKEWRTENPRILPGAWFNSRM